MLKVAYLATELPVPKPKKKKLSKKQMILEMAPAILANRKIHDRLAAVKKNADLHAANDQLEKELERILLEKSLKK